MLVPLLEILHEIETVHMSVPETQVTQETTNVLVTQTTNVPETQVTQETLSVLVYLTILVTLVVTSQGTSVEYALVLT